MLYDKIQQTLNFLVSVARKNSFKITDPDNVSDSDLSIHE